VLSTAEHGRSWIHHGGALGGRHQRLTMKYLDDVSFQPNLQKPAVLLQQLQELSAQLCRAAAKLPRKHRQQAQTQLQRQSSQVVRCAQQLNSLAAIQRRLSGRDPLCQCTAADVDTAVFGWEDDPSDDEAPDDVIERELQSLSPAVEQQLRRVFAVTDLLSRSQVRRAGCRVLVVGGGEVGGGSL
jgi:hypothetical protein